MIKSIQGIFKDGKVELLEPAPTQGESRVVVTFVSETPCVDLRQRGIDEGQATELRTRLNSFADDWNRPEWDVYDEM